MSADSVAVAAGSSLKAIGRTVISDNLGLGCQVLSEQVAKRTDVNKEAS